MWNCKLPFTALLRPQEPCKSIFKFRVIVHKFLGAEGSTD